MKVVQTFQFPHSALYQACSQVREPEISTDKQLCYDKEATNTDKKHDRYSFPVNCLPPFW